MSVARFILVQRTFTCLRSTIWIDGKCSCPTQDTTTACCAAFRPCRPQSKITIVWAAEVVAWSENGKRFDGGNIFVGIWSIDCTLFRIRHQHNQPHRTRLVVTHFDFLLCLQFHNFLCIHPIHPKLPIRSRKDNTGCCNLDFPNLILRTMIRHSTQRRLPLVLDVGSLYYTFSCKLTNFPRSPNCSPLDSTVCCKAFRLSLFRCTVNLHKMQVPSIPGPVPGNPLHMWQNILQHWTIRSIHSLLGNSGRCIVCLLTKVLRSLSHRMKVHSWIEFWFDCLRRK